MLSYVEFFLGFGTNRLSIRLNSIPPLHDGMLDSVLFSHQTLYHIVVVSILLVIAYLSDVFCAVSLTREQVERSCTLIAADILYKY